MIGYFRRGRHRKPSTTGRTVARFAVVGMAVLGPVAVSTGTASADPLSDIAQCESGGNIRAVNPTSTASGKYQFLDSTWRALGGKGRAKDASEATQDAMAQKLFAEQGSAPWVCKPGNAAAKKAAKTATQSAKPAGKRAQVAQSAPKRAQVAAAAPKRAPRAAHTKPAAVGRQRPAQGPVSGDTVVVRAGDTLSGLAAAHGESWRAVWAANRATVADPDMIFPGERIKV